MLLSRTWLGLSARRAERRLRHPAPRAESLIHRYVPGKSFADIGTMWYVDGGRAFLAEEAGANAVTAFDAMEPTVEFEAQHERLGSSVRFVRGDLHAPETPERVGTHDVVWCTGLMYHTPSPMLAWERLAAMSREYVIIGTKTVPEVPGIPGAAILFPALGDEERKPYARIWGPGPSAPYDPDPSMSYANWWWGFTPSAFVGMLGRGWDIVETLEEPRGTHRDDLILVLRRRS